jgi:hypothetical protein
MIHSRSRRHLFGTSRRSEMSCRISKRSRSAPDSSRREALQRTTFRRRHATQERASLRRLGPMVRRPRRSPEGRRRAKDARYCAGVTGLLLNAQDSKSHIRQQQCSSGGASFLSVAGRETSFQSSALKCDYGLWLSRIVLQQWPVFVRIGGPAN